jgi:feruloyl-CoA synthase
MIQADHTPARPFRKVNLALPAVDVRRTADGVIYLASPQSLAPYPERVTERLAHWARVAPERTFIAKRDASGHWRRLRYAHTWQLVRRIAQALLDRQLSAERPIVILSGNDLEHALLALAALHVGVAYAPISTAYSLVSQNFDKITHIVSLLTPGLVFTSNGRQYERAITAAVPAGTELVVTDAPPQTRRATPFGALEATHPTEAVEMAHRRVGPGTVAKFLFTSGSTGLPKGVVNTHGMMGSNQQMIRQVLAFLDSEPPVLVDWLPWNHTFGGNHNFGIVLFNGGSLYIDEGNPLPGQIEKTAANLRETAPTIYFNVPKGFENLISYFENDRDLRTRFFGAVQILFYAGAALSQHVWDSYERLASQTCGERIPIITGLGATETGPAMTFAHWAGARAGDIGLPLPGQEIKLVPTGDKLEIRARGPAITPGYWRQDAQTRAAFDEEGFYCLGDAVKLVDPEEPQKGLLFDGRVAEDFKLSTGTWVSVGPLRAQVMAACAPYVQDVVIAGHDRDYLSVLVFPNVDECRSLCPSLSPDVGAAEILGQEAVRARFQELIDRLSAGGTGSATRVVRAILLDTPPSLDVGEATDKGSINQRAVLQHRAQVVDELYSPQPSPRTIVVRRRAPT